mmetsp:Transcript_34968/g.138476  ORF Transcript_34968/g.138476 Transcript_34968/m.138476 type:complete len:250 (-) Transcript_34968:444-1193(-)
MIVPGSGSETHAAASSTASVGTWIVVPSGSSYFSSSDGLKFSLNRNRFASSILNSDGEIAARILSDRALPPPSTFDTACLWTYPSVTGDATAASSPTSTTTALTLPIANDDAADPLSRKIDPSSGHASITAPTRSTLSRPSRKDEDSTNNKSLTPSILDTSPPPSQPPSFQSSTPTSSSGIASLARPLLTHHDPSSITKGRSSDPSGSAILTKKISTTFPEEEATQSFNPSQIPLHLHYLARKCYSTIH